MYFLDSLSAADSRWASVSDVKEVRQNVPPESVSGSMMKLGDVLK